MKTCKSCQRYVHNDEVTCPFCSSNELGSEPASPSLGRGVSRARVYAARAAIAGAALAVTTACGDDGDQDDATSQSGGQASTGGQTNTGGQASTGGQTNTGGQINTGGAEDASGGTDNSGGFGGDVGIPIYGGPFPDMAKARV